VRITIRPDARQVVRDAFKCVICLLAPCASPLAYQACCKSVIGCVACVDELYKHAPSSACPKCRAPRGVASMHEVLGFQEMLEALSYLNGIANVNNDDDDDDLPDPALP
jgi:hypothetical protein